MIDAKSPKPLYEQIKDYILSNIHSGHFEMNSRIPSERNLAQQFGVSRLTVSKAIKELEQEGWLQTQIGKGTFIVPNKIDQELSALSSFTEEMGRRGKQTNSRVISAEIVFATPEIAPLLNVSAGVELARLCRVRLANEEPIALENSYLIAEKCPNIFKRFNFARESLYHVLREEYAIMMTHAEQTFEARGASETEARHLRLEAGSPILSITRVTYTTNDYPIEYVESAYRGDRYKFRAVLRRI